MNCRACNVECQKFGKHRNGLQRFRCPVCRKTYTEEHERLFAPMTVPEDKAACSLHSAHYNFCRIHKSLRVTPAMESGITDHVWSLRELLA